MATRSRLAPHEPTARLLERAARATPAAVDAASHGWWLRHTTARQMSANAVIAHVSDGRLDESIDAAERFYRTYESPARFQLCAGCVPGLDDLLDVRAYARTAPVSLETCAADEVGAPRPRRGLRADVAYEPTPDWLAVANSDAEPSDAARGGLLRRVRNPSTYVTVYERNEPIAIGRSVAERGWAGVFDMATLPLARGRGAGRLVLSTLALASIDRGAQWVYLQVERANDRARRLYRRAGFREIDTYYYRVRPRV
ncbi:GNAT family N-acetyltransferase [Solicola gregarius]|uniref:GNAT family N-acetyltransferase n=1 Tax=Solicola gregarius TaxID=2908642 RepID=A0AA46TL05_9ACTN|nr:GNAT family N-acetyltransferase [Solicola gregarius]UYM07210.1 GNAT family N-acetyltransferase [Solicola gregarius]